MMRRRDKQAAARELAAKREAAEAKAAARVPIPVTVQETRYTYVRFGDEKSRLVHNGSEIVAQLLRQLAVTLDARDHAAIAFAAGVILLRSLSSEEREEVLANHFQGLLGVFGEEELINAVKKAAARQDPRRLLR